MTKLHIIRLTNFYKFFSLFRILKKCENSRKINFLLFLYFYKYYNLYDHQLHILSDFPKILSNIKRLIPRAKSKIKIYLIYFIQS